MKRILILILTLILAAALASCAGIGDGALIGDISGTDGGDFTAVLKAFDAGEFNYSYAETYITGGEAKELYNTFDSADYVQGVDRVAMEMPYVELTFGVYKLGTRPEGDSFDAKYRIYSDDYVVFESSGATVPKGHLDGMYEKLIADHPILSKPETQSRSEVDAGFSFNRLLVRSGQEYEFKASDFEDLGCIDVRYLMNDEKNNSKWWTFTFDSCTEDEIRNIATKLLSREGINFVEFDAILTLH